MNIGIMGGSFNPIHVGHAIIANYIIQNTDIDQLWLMVSPENPFKTGQAMINEAQRLRMVEMVTRRLDNVITSGFELTLPRPSYTIDTLTALKAKFTSDNFTLVIGADNWAVFNKWRSHDEIISNFKIVVYPRVGYDIVIPPEMSDRVIAADAPVIEVSSSKIREQLSMGHDMRFFMPDEVYEYILRNDLYKK
ncbi:nicotinate (nicotinamide) nucleotide adenylyltransferase [Sodaliphilus sp.]|uniref:nicotinate (nicotinamide) nucleotide adenylyltransferase n=1 Tax=Sodaliphilus sp. TaxID=2815818 RepID=UPI00388FCF26